MTIHARFSTAAATRPSCPAPSTAERPRPVRIVGKHCESGDLIVPDAYVPDELTVGDIVATPVTGAYGYSMASTYNKVPRPAVIFVADGAARVVVRRETLRRPPETRRMSGRRAACTVWW